MPGPGGPHGGGHGGPGGGRGGFGGGPRGGHGGFGGGPRGGRGGFGPPPPRPPRMHRWRPYRYGGGCCGCMLPILTLAAVAVGVLAILFF